ncbi:GntR family transcriptional regulator [Bacillus sp. J14TS2]|uniref:DnaD domain-containing protein n=1 Tax=Bacillus sp. J14TS2 TaxID=2807188 RepID=UPI001B140609|nr:DnaD domain protein [Bacillus sp. J14TS2]GIN71168.1 GntR family transcriptional regulator [Bacillus sp. J14TS2]
MGGWIKFHRKILENELWHDVTTFRLFTLLLLQASHKDGLKIKGIEINRGQYLRSYSKLAEDLEFKEGRGYKKVSKSTIKRSVQKLIDEGMVTVRETDSGTVFSIVKYHEYQGLEGNEESFNRTDSGTLTERTQNEDGTNPEQEQELKNLRIKEFKEKVVVESPPNDLAAVFRFYEQNGFGTIGTYITEKIIAWCDDLSEALVLEALKQSIENGKKFWSYTEGILKNWDDKNIKTVEQAHADRLEHKEKASQSYPRRRATRVEALPDWFGDEDKGPEEAEFTKEQEAKRKRLEEIQDKYRKKEAETANGSH